MELVPEVVNRWGPRPFLRFARTRVDALLTRQMRSGSEAICVFGSQPFEPEFDRSDDIISSSYHHLLQQSIDRALDDPDANTLRGKYRQLLYIVPDLKKQDIP
jgi:hypothetical protein